MAESYSMDEYISKLKELGIYVSYNPDYKYMTYSDAEGHKCRDAKLFDERLLKKNLELYFFTVIAFVFSFRPADFVPFSSRFAFFSAFSTVFCSTSRLFSSIKS